MSGKRHSASMERIMKKPVFTVRDLVNASIPVEYARQRLHRLVRAKRAVRIERGKYTASDDAILVAGHITLPSYISLWSAMRIRNLTSQIPFSIDVVTSRKRFNREIDFSGSQIRFHQVKPAMMFGYENIVWGGHRIPVAKTEKVIIDALYLGSVPPDELSGALENADRELLREYASMSGNRRLYEAIEEVIKC